MRKLYKLCISLIKLELKLFGIVLWCKQGQFESALQTHPSCNSDTFQCLPPPARLFSHLSKLALFHLYLLFKSLHPASPSGSFKLRPSLRSPRGRQGFLDAFELILQSSMTRCHGVKILDIGLRCKRWSNVRCMKRSVLLKLLVARKRQR